MKYKFCIQGPELLLRLFLYVWEQRKVGEYYDFKNGLNKGKEYFGVGTPIVNFTDVFHLRGIYEKDLKGKVSLTRAEIANFQVKMGDIFFTRTSETIDEIGFPSVMLDEPEDTVFSGFVLRGRALQDDPLTLQFKRYVFFTDAFRKEMVKKSSITTRALTSGTAIKNMEFVFPKNKKEQARIGAFFCHLDHLITLHQGNDNLTTRSYEFGFSHMAIAWEQRKLSNYLETSNEKNLSGRYTRYDVLSVSGDFGIVNQIEFQGRSFAGASVLNYGIVNTGDVVYTKSPLNSNPFGIIKTNKGKTGIVSTLYAVYHPKNGVDPDFIQVYFEQNARINTYLHPLVNKGAKNDMKVSAGNALKGIVSFPNYDEQKRISEFFATLDRLITLHQRKQFNNTGGRTMLSQVNATELFSKYYEHWITVYKDGAVRNVTMKKYLMTQSWISKLAPNLRVCDLTRVAYQQLLNDYAVFHERQTTMDFHHQLKGAILDAVDEGLIAKDPTRKAIIKGKNPREKKRKYLNQFELHKLLSNLNLHRGICWDWLILLVAKTGIRFSEALAITPKDFDFAHQTLSISKTWDYKGKGGFLPTKNVSSVRKIQIDWQTVIQFSELVKNMPPEEPIFVIKEHMYNSTANAILARHCIKSEIPIISIHGLRHTHASLLLFAGVSIASVARRLGHSSMTTTQKTYLHIIHELENKDIDLVMRSISSLG